MRLYVTKPSPYARKAWSAVFELGLERQVEIVELPPRMPTVPKPELEAVNPLAKVPSLITGDGELIVDSPVIVAFFDHIGGGKLIPSGAERWRALSLEALADGCMDAGVVVRVDQLRPDSQKDPVEVAVHQEKIHRTLDMIEKDGSWLPRRFDVGALALLCAIEWIEFRALVPELLKGRPRIAEWVRAHRDRTSLRPTRP